MPYFSEAVHVELPDEGCEVAVLEVGWQHLLSESADAVDGETVSSGGPADDIAVLVFLAFFEGTSNMS